MSNLQFCKRETRDRIEGILASNGISFWLKDALRAALDRDCVDAYHDAVLLADTLRAVCNET